MDSAVDLTARTSGLLPSWLFLVVVVLWLLAIGLSFRYRPARLSALPYQLIAGGALALGNALFFWRPLFTPAHVPMGGGDLVSFFFTLHADSADRITDGELPLWNPFLHGGMPHLANFQAGVLYPLNLIAYLLAQPFSYATLESLAILHYLIASAGVYLLLRSLNATRVAAVAGGLIFAYSGFMVAHLGHYSMISVAAWVPWLLWATHRLVQFPRWTRVLPLAALVFLAATGGHQQTLLFALVGTGVWWLFLFGRYAGVRIPGIGRQEAVGRESRGALPYLFVVRLVPFGGAVGGGLLVAAPMILPSLRLAQRSVRASLGYEQASEFSVQPVALLQLVLPTVFGSNPTDYWGAFSSGEIWGYAGVVTLVLAALALAIRPSSIRIFFGLVAVAAVLYAVGPWAPLHGWVYKFVPLFDLIRAPARAFLFLDLALAVLAALAVSDLVSGRGRGVDLDLDTVLDRAVKVITIVVAALALFIIPLAYSQILRVNDPSNRPVIAADNLQMLLIFLVLLLAVLWLARQRVLWGVALGVLLSALVVVDLFSATAPFNPTDQDLVAGYREPEVAAFLQEQWNESGPYRIEVRHEGLQPNFGSVHGVHVASGVFDPMQPAAYTRLYNTVSSNPALPAYDLLNVRYWLTPQDADEPPGFEPVFTSAGGTTIWERESARPRAWFVSSIVEPDGRAPLDMVLDPGFRPAEEVILADPPVRPDGSADGEVEITTYEDERIVLDIDADGLGYVVLSEGSYPGWSAEIDGQPAEVLTANEGVRAVAVGEGAQRIVLRYEPEIVSYSFVISGIGILFILGLTLVPTVFRRTGYPTN